MSGIVVEVGAQIALRGKDLAMTRGLGCSGGKYWIQNVVSFCLAFSFLSLFFLWERLKN